MREEGFFHGYPIKQNCLHVNPGDCCWFAAGWCNPGMLEHQDEVSRSQLALEGQLHVCCTQTDPW